MAGEQMHIDWETVWEQFYVWYAENDWEPSIHEITARMQEMIEAQLRQQNAS